MTITARTTLTRRRRKMVLLSVRTVGEPNLARMDISIYPTMMHIFARPALCTPDLRVQTTTIRYTSRTSWAGSESLDLTRRMPTLQMFTRQARARSSRLCHSMLLMQRRHMKYMWPQILRTLTIWQIRSL